MVIIIYNIGEDMRTNSNDYILYALGARGSRPTHGKQYEIFGGQTTCFIIKHQKYAIIIDCGTGLYEAGKILEDCEVIDVVFTHVHYDHILGLLDFSVFPKNVRINFIGTFKSWLSHETLKDFYRHPFWPISPKIGAICEIENDGTEYNLSNEVKLRTFNSNHPDYGNVLLFDIADERICFMFDIETTGGIDLNLLRDCRLLIFDGMFDDGEYHEHIGWGHSTYQEGCRLASIYNCKELLITHHNPKNDDATLIKSEEKAKKIFSNTRFCRAGDIFLIKH